MNLKNGRQAKLMGKRKGVASVDSKPDLRFWAADGNKKNKLILACLNAHYDRKVVVYAF